MLKSTSKRKYDFKLSEAAARKYQNEKAETDFEVTCTKSLETNEDKKNTEVNGSVETNESSIDSAIKTDTTDSLLSTSIHSNGTGDVTMKMGEDVEKMAKLVTSQRDPDRKTVSTI